MEESEYTMNMNPYYEKVIEKMKRAFEAQEDVLEACAQEIARCVSNGGIVHAFGTGHSHMLAEELFYRAGGLGSVNAILVPALMLHEAAELGTYLERMEGIADFVVRREDIRPGDVLIAFSNSGRNAVPIEMVQLAKERGAFTIGIGSGAYRDLPSRHSMGIKMSDMVDIFLDNESDEGDACVKVGCSGSCMGATSTVIGAALLESIIVRVAQLLDEAGCELPFFMSANGAGDQDEHNRALMDRYRARVRSF